MKIVFMPGNKVVEIERGITLLEAAREAGVAIDSACGGNYSCGKCKVLVTKGNDGNYLPEERKMLTEEELKRGMRLACCCRAGQDMAVMVPAAAPSFGKPSEKRYFQKEEGECVPLAIAIDVGTTTIEAHIVHAKTLHVMKKLRFYNPQIAFGADVVARITYAAGSTEREKKLRDVLLLTLNEELRKALAELGAKEEQVERIAVVGNTTMSYILSNTPLSYLARAPFPLMYRGNSWYTAEKAQILENSGADVFIGPNIGGHVGSDAFACLMAAGLAGGKGRKLLVDVGTNGEILLSDNGKIYACSTAAGPAFEGAGLSCGMRADQGAITKAAVVDGHLACQVEGNVAAKGISGSGIIDVLSGMLKLHVMEDTGYLKEEHCFVKGYEVTKNVFVSRQDVRQIQLAKGAIFAGIICLLRVAGIQEEEIDTLYLAGAFGSNINIKNAMRIGLLPRMPLEKVQYMGNAAIAGAKEMLQVKEKDPGLAKITEQCIHVELANLEGFQETFIQSINFRSDLF